MSVQATRWAWEQKVGNASAKLVLLALADRADGRGCVSFTHLAYVTELNRKTVYTALNKLKSAGLIADTGARRGVSIRIVVYRLCMSQVAA